MSSIVMTVFYYRSKTGFSAAIFPNVDRSGWNLAGICCCTVNTCGFNFTLIGAWAAPGQTCISIRLGQTVRAHVVRCGRKFWPLRPQLHGHGRNGPLITYPSPGVVILRTLVALCGRTHYLGVPKMCELWAPPHVSHHTKFGCSRSNGVRLLGVPRKLWGLGPASLG